MAYRAGDVRPGKCFLTGGDARPQVRRVRAAANGSVTYESRELKGRKPVWTGSTEITMEQFLAEAAREVGSDFAG